MPGTLEKGQLEHLFEANSSNLSINEYPNIISLTSNEIAELSLQLSKKTRTENSIDKIFKEIINVLGESGIAERILLFQVDGDKSVTLTNYWESSYITKVNPVGFQIKQDDLPLFKIYNKSNKNTFQVEDISKFLSLPNYLIKIRIKAFFIKLKTKSVLITPGSTNNSSIFLSLQFSTRNVVWSNEVEKLLQSIVDQIVIAKEQFKERKNKEKLQENIIELKESALKEQEELQRQFASDLHDIPCSFIPRMKAAIDKKNLDEIRNLVDELNKNMRMLISEYVIPDLNLLGFIPTVYQYINNFRKIFKGNLILNLPEDEINISQKKAAELLKVMREWLCNVEKHSFATDLHFSLKRINENLFLMRIKDNGRGFDTNDIKKFGFGITNIKRRLQNLNANFNIKSRVNKGSILEIQFNID